MNIIASDSDHVSVLWNNMGFKVYERTRWLDLVIKNKIVTRVQ